MQRRDILAGIGAAALAGRTARASDAPWLSPALPEGARAEARWGTLPGKQKLIQLSDRPPNYETPIEAFTSAVTPNDSFFVRYHLADVPTMESLAGWALELGGDAATGRARLTMDDLRAMPQTEVSAVCQCSGNRRGLSQPHVAGVEWGYGAMGSALWRGPRLRDVLARVGVKSDAVEVWLDGADGPVLPGTPDFRKSLPLAKAMADETIIALTMNGAPLPLPNGYPARLIVPGWTATYWMKHLTHVDASSKPLGSFWMQKAYRVPAGMFPVEQPFASQADAASVPITEIVVNAVIAAPVDGVSMPRAGFTVQGVAWDRGHGIRTVQVSVDGGASWRDATLGPDLGPFAFRAFSLDTGALSGTQSTLSARAINNAGEAQAPVLKFNPAGYHNNVPQTLTVTLA
jgi:DMSO/TMAO reductase YedYZ molybdopterin-dependent catalytic subunit